MYDVVSENSPLNSLKFDGRFAELIFNDKILNRHVSFSLLSFTRICLFGQLIVVSLRVVSVFVRRLFVRFMDGRVRNRARREE